MMKTRYYWIDKADPYWNKHLAVPDLQQDPVYASKKEAKAAYREYANDPAWQGADFNPKIQLFKVTVEKC